MDLYSMANNTYELYICLNIRFCILSLKMILQEGFSVYLLYGFCKIKYFKIMSKAVIIILKGLLNTVLVSCTQNYLQLKSRTCNTRYFARP